MSTNLGSIGQRGVFRGKNGSGDVLIRVLRGIGPPALPGRGHRWRLRRLFYFLLVSRPSLIALSIHDGGQRRCARSHDRGHRARAPALVRALVYRYSVKLILPVDLLLVLGPSAQSERVELGTLVLPSPWLQAVVLQHGRIAPGHVVVAIVGA